MILRDPVHGLVAFEGDDEKLVAALLATREVQRLRRVRQLGLTSLVFPGAEHSRFAHAIGTAYVMQKLQRRIREVHGELPPDQRLDRDAAREALAAALLHDLGHGPFSHLYEGVQPSGRHHEAWTADAIRDDTTEVHQALEGLSRGMAARVADLLEGRHRLRYLARAVSGMLDVDRADYLLRDSHMTGVRYGLYDLEWLLRAFTFGWIATEEGGEHVLAVEGRKGLPPFESFFLARHFMYQQVYHHKATRAAEALIRGLFVRVGELVREGRAPRPLPEALRCAALGEKVRLADYLRLDDPALMSSFASWECSNDEVLAGLAGRLQARRLPKTVPLAVEREAQWAEIHARASAIVAAAGTRADLTVFLDEPTDIPYAEPPGNTPEGLWVVISHRPIQRLGDASFLLRELRGKRIRRPRLIFPADHREAVLAGIADLLDQEPA